MSVINLKQVIFPYYIYSKNDKTIKRDFNKLKKYRPRSKPSNTNKSFNHYMLNFEREYDLLRITDYFSEDKRIRCQFNGHISVYDWYQKNKEKIITEYGPGPKYQDIDYHIWKNTKECSNFPIVMAMEVLKTFKVKKWLDPSSGWGDRLIAALAYGCDYQGFDPNTNMQENYDEMIDFFAPDEKNRYKITPKPFEKAKVKTNFYDLVFTSPPFFDLEDYDSASTQSHHAYPELKDWKEKFLYPLILTSELALTKKGHLALYISDNNTYPTYVKDTMAFIKKNTALSYQGSISWTLSRNIKRNIFIWIK